MKASAAVMGIVLSGALATLAGAADEGTVYRWVDPDGTPHYQDRPPEGAEAAQELSLRYKLTDSPALAAATKNRAEAQSVAQLREKQQAEDQASDDTDREKVLSEREQGCAKARERLQKYETAHRLYKPGPDGQRNYLSDEQIDAARLEARRTVEEWCGE
ncbi:MAG: DUF4124 domain-containing protein [Gammaproteobacteria bacterium]|nr:MAG: DUF4124 domain-containing protein [Gammaproteobacteria bacterium]